jgi:O-antigen/teichoic acid export membrane protein
MPVWRHFGGLISRLGIGRLGRNALLSTIGLGTRAVIQAAYLIVLSHWMGPKGYGLFAGSVAAAILMAPISGWGIAIVLAQYVSRDRTTSPSLWATAILQIVMSGSLLVVILLVASSVALVDRVGIGSMLALGLAELIALPLVQVATAVCLALEKGAAAALSMCLVPAFRLIAVVAPMIIGMSGTPSRVAMLHFLGSVLGVIVALQIIKLVGGSPDWHKRLSLRRSITEGTHFATGALVGTSYQEIDKVFLLQILGATVAGTYTAAFRVMTVFVLPVSALMGAALPRMFAEHGSPKGAGMLRAVTLSAAGYGIVASLAAALISPLMPLVFGSGFEVSSRYLLMLSPWGIVFALHQSAATGLTAWGGQPARVLIEGLGIALVVVLDLSLMQSLGAGAAALALLVAELFMACGCWFFLHRQSR